MNPLRILPLFILLACPVALGFVYVQEFLVVDEALDSGAAWDYVAARPDFVQSHPYMSLCAAQRDIRRGCKLVARGSTHLPLFALHNFSAEHRWAATFRVKARGLAEIHDFCRRLRAA
jgi:hypothetical protein